MSIASWANGYQATSGFADAPFVLDGNNATGYTETGVLASVSALTVTLDLCSAQTVYALHFVIGYEGSPNLIAEHSPDNLTWTTVVFHPSILFGAGSGVFSLYTFTPNLLTPTSDIFWRLSVKDTSNATHNSQMSVREYYALNSHGNPLGCVPPGGSVVPILRHPFLDGLPMGGKVY